MKISILCYNLSGNSLGRAFLLGELLENDYEIEIIGPEFGETIWSPLSGEMNYKSVDTSPLLYQFPFSVSKMLELITGDVVLACKPRTSSYGIGLMKKVTSKKPLLLDIDDWESGFYHDLSAHPWIYNIPRVISCNSFYYTKVLEQLSKCADKITVSNSFLKEKFGGAIIPHVRNTDKLSPHSYEKQSSRRLLGIPLEKDIVMFAGSPAPYKGIEDLIEAFPLNGAPDCQLYIVGIGDSDYENSLRKIASESTHFFGKKPFDQIPHWVAAADVIAIPQRARHSTRGQLPAKLFDAMALGKPVLATKVGDIPKILEGVGVVTEPGCPQEIHEKLSTLINDTDRQKKLGDAARRRCVQEYSYSKFSPILNDMVESLV